MIERLTAKATARCVNCEGAITLYQSDLRQQPEWSHDETGTKACPGAPTALPAYRTVQPVTS